MQIRPLTGEDRGQLGRFFDRVPDADRDFLKEDLDDPGLIDRWLSGRRGQWMLGVEDGGVAGLAGLLPWMGRSAHVGELRLLVDPARRRRGYGRALARAALVEAFELGLTHIFVEVGAEQEALIAMFGALGFEPEALLRDFVRDQGGSSHDLVMLTHRVEELWSEMLTLGLGEEQPVR
ncbi:MAG TPA: GNAT family N-acetyltransferase [Solirubrobacteraceae bacterium]|jgi:RimJ/RimL family protein N-acetyltransferase|nr:GNAT family N-acetyltransferase [Solirubrobacteraceae bacterium]